MSTLGGSLRKFLSLSIVLCLLIVGLAAFPIGSAEPEEVGTRGTLYVGSGQTYTTIQSAIDAAVSGDKIEVYQGTYYENIIIDKDIWIKGKDSEPKIIGNGYGNVVIINSTQVTFEGFNISGSGMTEFDAGIRSNFDEVIISECVATENYNGIVSSGDSCWISGCTAYLNYGIGIDMSGYYNMAENCSTHHNFGSGMHLPYGQYNTIRYHESFDNNWSGIQVAQAENNEVKDSTVYRNRVGIYITMAMDANNITNCYSHSNREEGVVINADYTRLLNCRIENNGRFGLAVYSDYAFVFGNMFKDNTAEAIRNQANNGVIHHNTIYSTYRHALDNGTNNQWDDGFEGNFWSNWTSPDSNSDGIVDNPFNVPGSAGSKDYFPLTTTNYTFKKLQIVLLNGSWWYEPGETIEFGLYNSGTEVLSSPISPGFYVLNSDNDQVYTQDIGATVITPLQPGEMINLSWNQLDNTSSQVPDGYYTIHCDDFEISAQKTIYIETDPNTTAGSGRVQNKRTYQRYEYVQEAIDDAQEGDTIQLWEGTHIGNFVVDKTLTITGNSTWGTSCQSPGNGDVIRIRADNCQIRYINFTVEEYSPYGSDMSGAYIMSDNNLIQDCNFYNHFNGIYIDSGSYNQIKDCYFTFNVNCSIALQNSHFGEVSNCDFYKSNYGVILESSTQNIIDNNDFWAQENTGLFLLRKSNYNSIWNNSFDMCWNLGIDIASGPSGNVITYNRFSFNCQSPYSEGSQAADNNGNNRWNSSFAGNYWSDHTSPDSDNNNIVDTPYDIDGSINAKDHFPLTEPWIHIDPDNDNTAPCVLSTLPTYDAKIWLESTKYLMINFSESMDRQETEWAFNISPSRAFSIDWDDSYHEAMLITVPDGFEKGVQYKITVEFYARDLAGNRMIEDFIWKFSIGSAPDSDGPEWFLVGFEQGELDEDVDPGVDVSWTRSDIVLDIEEDTPEDGKATLTQTWDLVGTCSSNVDVIHIYQGVQQNDNVFTYYPFYDMDAYDKVEIEPVNGFWSYTYTYIMVFDMPEPVDDDIEPQDDVYTNWFCSIAWTDEGDFNLDESVMNIVQTGDLPNDSDNDKLPDDWENKYDLDTDKDDSGEDEDGDGFTNWEEYLAGTDPTNSDSRPGGAPNGTVDDDDDDNLNKEFLTRGILIAGILVFLVITVLIILVIVIRRRGEDDDEDVHYDAPPEEIDLDIPPEQQQQELPPPPEHGSAEQFDWEEQPGDSSMFEEPQPDIPDTYLDEIEQEASEFERPSDFLMSKRDMLMVLEGKYNSGELTEEEFNELKDAIEE